MTSVVAESEFQDYLSYSQSMNLSFTELKLKPVKPDLVIPPRSPARLRGKSKIEDSPCSSTDVSLFDDCGTIYSDRSSIFSSLHEDQEDDDNSLCLDGIDIDELLDEISLSEDAENILGVDGIVTVVAVNPGIGGLQPKLTYINVNQ